MAAPVFLALWAICCLSPTSALAATGHEYERSFGPDCTESSEFENPGAVAVDETSGYVYVADLGSGVSEVFRCTTAGAEAEFTAGLGAGTNHVSGFVFSFGQGESQIAVSPASHDFYVADVGHSAVEAFEPTGAEAEFTAGPATGTNMLSGPDICGVAVDANGAIYVGSRHGGPEEKGTVEVYASSGEALTSFETPHPCNVAVNSHGAVYVDHFETKSIEEYVPSLFPVTAATTYPTPGTFALGGTDYALAVDPSNNDLYAAQRPAAEHSQVAQLDEAGELIGVFATPGEAGPLDLSESEGVAVDGSSGDVYVSDSAEGEHNERRVKVFAPAAPNPPSVGASSVTDITATTANLQALVNPEHFRTHYRFQYLTEAEYLLNGESFTGPDLPLETPDANLGSAGTAQPARAQLSGLQADTTYVFRVAAENENNEGSPEFGAVAPGEEGEFHTYPAFPATLPDGRAYELVSPAAKGGEVYVPEKFGQLGGSCGEGEECTPGILSQMMPMQSAPDGEAVVYEGNPFKAGLSSGANEYLGTRAPGGWRYEGLSEPQFVNGPQGQGYVGVSPDLSRGVIFQVEPALSSEAPSSGGKSFANLYLRGPDGNLQPLLTEEPTNRLSGTRECLVCEQFQIFFRAGNAGTEASPAFGHLVFEANDALTDATGIAPEAEDGGVAAAGGQPTNLNLYEWSGGQLRLVNVRPGNTETSPGAVLGSGRLGAEEPERENSAVDHAISADGSRIFWSEEANSKLYLRENADTTTQVSASQKTNGLGPGGTDPAGPKPATFLDATASGSEAFFTSKEELTNDASTGVAGGLGRANLDGSGVNQSFIAVPPSASGVAVDGSHVYWANPSTNSIGRANLDGSGANQSLITLAEIETSPGVFSPAHPQYIAVDGSHIYWTNATDGVNGHGTIGRANLDGSSPEESFITGASTPKGIAVNATNIYWANVGTTAATRRIGSATIAGASVNQALTGTGTTASSASPGIALDGTFIYWASSNSAVTRATLPAATSPNASFLTGLHAVRGLAVDGTFIYWANSSTNAIGRATIAGASPNQSFIAVPPSTSGVAVDGFHVYWGTAGSPDSGADLYGYDTESGGLTDLTVDSTPSDIKGADVRGIAGATEDGSRIYFVAGGVLAGENAEHRSPVVGQNNLYLWDEGTTTFIGTLLNIDNEFAALGRKFGDWKRSSSDRLAQVSADGNYLAFMSQAPLTGYDNTFRGGGECPPATGAKCFEVFEYNADAEALSCASCNPTGLRPSGYSNLSLINGEEGLPPLPQPGNLSSEGGGRLFFESQDTLSPRDTNNGRTDVYEFEPDEVGSCERAAGCVFLISSGRSISDSAFIDSTPSGRDAFFVTRSQLLPSDQNEQLDLYDARVGGGFDEGKTTPCGGEACKGPAGGEPAQPGPGSAEFTGPGNPNPKPHHKKHHKHKRHRHKRHSKKRATKRNRGGGK